MSRHGRYALPIIAATLLAVVLPLSLGFATSVAAQTPDDGTVRLNHLDASALPEVAATVSVRPIGAKRLDADAFTVTAGSNKVPSTVENIDVSKLQVVLVVDPGPNAEGAATVGSTAVEFARRVMPKAAVTVVSGGAAPKVILGANHDLLRTETAIRAIQPGPASLLDSIALALFQQTDDPANTAAVAVAAEATGTDTAAWTIAANAAKAQRSIDVVLPGLATVPKLLEPLTTVGSGRVTPAANALAAVAAVDQISETLSYRYRVLFKVPTGTSQKDDLALRIDTGSAAGVQSVALNVPAQAVTGPTPNSTPSNSQATTVGKVSEAPSTPAKTTDESGSSALPWVIAAAVVLVLLGAIVPVQRRRRMGSHSVARRARRPPPVDAELESPATADQPPEPDRPSTLDRSPPPVESEPLAAPAAGRSEVRATIDREPEEDRSSFGQNGDHQQQKQERFTPATGQARLDRRLPTAVADKRLDRGTPGARWWMYQRPDTGHETASASGSGDPVSRNGADDKGTRDH